MQPDQPGFFAGLAAADLAAGRLVDDATQANLQSDTHTLGVGMVVQQEPAVVPPVVNATIGALGDGLSSPVNEGEQATMGAKKGSAHRQQPLKKEL